MYAIKHLITGSVFICQSDPIYTQGFWECGDQRFSDPSGGDFAPLSERVNPRKISPVEFKLLFTATERVAIKSAREGDPIIEDIFDILDDPRLTHVDLDLPSTAQSIGYLAHKGLIAPDRIGPILSAAPQ